MFFSILSCKFDWLVIFVLMKQFFTTLLVLFFLNPICGSTQQEAFEAANRVYQSNDYEAAIVAYEQLLTEGFHSAELYYNLGNSYWKAEKTGYAVLNYERALRLDPKDPDLVHNLEIVRSALKDEIEALPPFFLAQWWDVLVKLLPGGSWTIISILSFWVFAGGIFFWLFGKDRAQKKKGLLIAMIFLFLSFLTFFLSYSQRSNLTDGKEAVILVKEVVLRSAPDSESQKELDLHEGTKVIILDQIGEWFKIQLVNGDQGWLEQKVVEKI